MSDSEEKMTDEEMVWAEVDDDAELYPCINVMFAKTPDQTHLDSYWYNTTIMSGDHTSFDWCQIPKTLADKYQRLRDELDEVEEQILDAYKKGTPLPKPKTKPVTPEPPIRTITIFPLDENGQYKNPETVESYTQQIKDFTHRVAEEKGERNG